MPAASATVAQVSNAAAVNGSATAYSCAMAPPIDTPARWNRVSPSPPELDGGPQVGQHPGIVLLEARQPRVRIPVVPAGPGHARGPPRPPAFRLPHQP